MGFSVEAAPCRVAGMTRPGTVRHARTPHVWAACPAKLVNLVVCYHHACSLFQWVGLGSMKAPAEGAKTGAQGDAPLAWTYTVFEGLNHLLPDACTRIDYVIGLVEAIKAHSARALTADLQASRMAAYELVALCDQISTARELYETSDYNGALVYYETALAQIARQGSGQRGSRGVHYNLHSTDISHYKTCRFSNATNDPYTVGKWKDCRRRIAQEAEFCRDIINELGLARGESPLGGGGQVGLPGQEERARCMREAHADWVSLLL